MRNKLKLLVVLALATALYALPYIVALADTYPCPGSGC